MNIAYNMDCVTGMKQLEDNSIDLTVTSPPYDNIRDYNGFNFDWEETIKQLYRVTKDGGVVVWIVSDQTINGNETGTSFRQALFAKECGFNLHDTMIWEKEGCTFPETRRYYQVFEYMFIWVKGKLKTFNPIIDRKNYCVGEKLHGTCRQKDGSLKDYKSGNDINYYGCRFNVWRINAEKNNKTGHPAVFPVGLVKDHIITWSNKKDLVLDPFLGSGTTRIACWDLDRNFIGYEISKKYFDQQEERFNWHSSQIDMMHLLEDDELTKEV